MARPSHPVAAAAAGAGLLLLCGCGSSAAPAAGYTLAAGPVRADAIQTDTNGLTAGEARAGGAKPI